MEMLLVKMFVKENYQDKDYRIGRTKKYFFYEYIERSIIQHKESTLKESFLMSCIFARFFPKCILGGLN